MFGTSGIRGIYGTEITEELAVKVASVFAKGRLVVGRDIRESGSALFDAVASGAAQAGAQTIDLGIVPTPTVALATRKHSCRGIMITASHNPPEYNGLKLIEDGKEIGKALEMEVQERFKKADAAGKEPIVSRDDGIVTDHKRMVFSLVDADAIRERKPKIAVDCNGAAATITPSLLHELGCDVVAINTSLKGFSRPSEPSKENLEHLPRLIEAANADFGIAHDGDGDRCVLMDDTGEVLPLDVQLAIMIEHELSGSKNRRIVSTVEASLAIREVVEKAGGEIIITPVGSTYVGEALEERDCLFGGEPCGEYIYRDGVHVPDAVLGAAKFAEIFSKKGRFSELKKGYEQNPMAREKYPAEDKHGAMGRIREAVARLGIVGRLRDDDGIRIDEEDGWFLIRASGTEPVIRLTMEYKTEKRLHERGTSVREAIMEGI